MIGKTLVILANIFLFCSNYSEINVNYQGFYKSVFMIGLVYLMSDPCVMLTSSMIEETYREQFYKFIDQGIHILTQAVLLKSIISRSSLGRAKTGNVSSSGHAMV